MNFKNFISKIKSFGKKISEKTKNVLAKSKILLTKVGYVLYYGFGIVQVVRLLKLRIGVGMAFYDENHPEETQE